MLPKTNTPQRLDDSVEASAGNREPKENKLPQGATAYSADVPKRIGRPPRPTPERFWEKVDKNGPVPAHCPELGPCWIWTAKIEKKSGYGRFKVGHAGQVMAHRLSVQFSGRSIPDGMLVCHSCDNRRCVNPGHLFVGSHSDNTRDSIRKGRWPTKNWFKCKITDAQVIELTNLRSNGWTTKALSEKYKISQTQVKDISNGRSRGAVTNWEWRKAWRTRKFRNQLSLPL